MKIKNKCKSFNRNSLDVMKRNEMVYKYIISELSCTDNYFQTLREVANVLLRTKQTVLDATFKAPKIVKKSEKPLKFDITNEKVKFGSMKENHKKILSRDDFSLSFQSDPTVFQNCVPRLLSCSPEISFEHDTSAKQVPNKAGKGTKRKAGKESENTKERASKSRKSSKLEKSDDKTQKPSKDKIPDVSAIDFSNESKSSGGNKWNFKISSWNVNGVRAWLEKNGLSYLHHEKPDVMCIQETKCSDDKLPEEVKEIEGYHAYWLSGDKEGYSGVGLISKEEPIEIKYGIDVSEHDNEGRVITAEFEKFYLVTSYVPNAGRGLVRLDYRMKWDKDFLTYLKKLDSVKPVILCGDLNVAHEEIDLANPKTNKRNAGFTKEEREGFSTLLNEGFIDTFRHLYPDVTGAYTFWTYMMNARAKNVGWRLDYFVISERFSEHLCDNVIRKDVFGSDHCPVTLFLSL